MTGRVHDRRVEVRVSDWEFGCCVRPITIGQYSRWWLTFQNGGEPVAHYVWSVTEAGGHPRLDGHGVAAGWWSPQGYDPAPGTHPMSGVLAGTAHSTDPGHVPAVVGRVLRLRLVSEELRWETRRRREMLVPVPDSVTTADVTRTPSSFDLEPGPGRRVAGVLIDLEI